jgi:hypothetical protein
MGKEVMTMMCCSYCFAVLPGHRPWCAMYDLVPGYLDSADGLADAADQARQDGAS